MPTLRPDIVVNRFKARLRGRLDSYLARVDGVIHVGANLGQERGKYRKYGLEAVWVEPIPEIFRELENNLAGFPRQKAYQYLVTDQNDREHVFHVASNTGESSSILELKGHKDIWPDIDYERDVVLSSITLDRLIEREQIDITRFQALVLDTQGAELLVLKGAPSTLGSIRYIEVEASDFEAYAGGTTLTELTDFLADRDFRELAREEFAQTADGSGRYFNVVFERGR
ncbi:MAG: FkbM family methyltransferase [Planctomycetota bacterium]